MEDSQEDQEDFRAAQVDSQEARVDSREVLEGFPAAQADSQEAPVVHQAEARQEGRHHHRRQPSCRRNSQQPSPSTQVESGDACTGLLTFG